MSSLNPANVTGSAAVQLNKKVNALINIKFFIVLVLIFKLQNYTLSTIIYKLFLKIAYIFRI